MSGKQQDFTILLRSALLSPALARSEKTVCYDRWAAPSGAITGNRHNDTPTRNEGGHMRTMRGRIIDPVELVRCQPFDDFPYSRGVEDK